MTTPDPPSSPRRGGRNRENDNMDTGNNNVRKMVNLDPSKCRIFFINSTPAKDLENLNSFIIKKVLTGCLGPQHTCTRLRSGTLRVEVQSQQQALDLQYMRTIHNVPVQVTMPFASNTSKGVVTHWEFARMTEEDIVKGMSDVGVVACRKFMRLDRHTNTRKPSSTVCLTFDTTTLPDSVCVAFRQCIS